MHPPSGVLIPLLLYADDLIIMSTTATGLQRQLDALQQFCQQRQLSVNLSETKVVTFGSKAACQAFMFNSNEVERVESYKYLGFEFHATKNLAHGVSQLVSSAKKAMHSMNRRFALLPISDPGLWCKLFDSLVLPILSYASEVWAVHDKIGDAAELLHRHFLKHLLGSLILDQPCHLPWGIVGSDSEFQDCASPTASVSGLMSTFSN